MSMFLPGSAFFAALSVAGTNGAVAAAVCTGTDPATEAYIGMTIGHTNGVADIGIPIYGSTFVTSETADASKNEVARGAVIQSVGVKTRIGTTALTAATPTIQLVTNATGAPAGTAVAFTGTIGTATTSVPTVETLTITGGVQLVSTSNLLIRINMTQTAGAVTALRLYGAIVTYTLLF